MTPAFTIFHDQSILHLAGCILTDTHRSKRVFLLGPSHHHYLEKGALTRCTHYGTPLGNLPIDAATTADLHETGLFDWMSQDVDEDEHSLEMHLPYIYKLLSKYHFNLHKTNLYPTDRFLQCTWCRPPSASPDHDRQHIRRHRTISRKGSRTIPRRPDKRFRNQLRLRPLGPPLPLHLLPTRYWRFHHIECQLKSSDRSRNSQINQGRRLRVYGRLRGRQSSSLAGCVA